ncbi:hypothetical protein N2152v2_005187 [Parachlorella kessleri]
MAWGQGVLALLLLGMLIGSPKPCCLAQSTSEAASQPDPPKPCDQTVRGGVRIHGGAQDLATVYADSSTQCCTVCRQRSGCVAWTYRISGSQPKCYLVAGKGEYIEINDGFDAGW